VTKEKAANLYRLTAYQVRAQGFEPWTYGLKKYFPLNSRCYSEPCYCKRLTKFDDKQLPAQ
jgi:hypothetical protein